MNRLKILILTNKILAYRVPVFNRLSEIYDLCVGYSMGDFCDCNAHFKSMKLPYFKFKRFVLHKNNIYKIASAYDVVICTGDIAWISYITLPFRKRKFKTIVWSIGVSASYDKPYDTVTKWDSVRDFFYNKFDAILFYSSYPVIKYINRGFAKEKLFVANNTVKVINTLSNVEKDSILFIGTLYRQKGIYLLLEAYLAVYKRYENIPLLNIVGSGDEYDNIKKFISDNALENKIKMLGAIYDINQKELLFKRSFACISPAQAGLSVLESMGYGVPFITHENAITGGERFNIHQDYNGLYFKTQVELENIIEQIVINQGKFIAMGRNALCYYNEQRTIDHMVHGFEQAICYVLNKK